jgi:hypothetical protein
VGALHLTYLHVLTIGINDYGDKAKDLHLDFASKDASDVGDF